MHSLNLGWFLQKFNELRADWATAEENITGALDAEIQRAEDALSDVFDARDAAAASATAAAGSASAAGTSATAAQNSATAAASSATLANNKATAAGLSEAAAAQSATQAGNSATAAAGSATQAGQGATNAAASETAAGNSASAAAGSATAAAGSATAAGQSATAAAQSAADAAASAALVSIIEDPSMPKSQYGLDFVIPGSGLTFTKKGNRINVRGTTTAQQLEFWPLSSDPFTAEFFKPAFLYRNTSGDASFNPSHIVLETTLINNRQVDSVIPFYIYSVLYTKVNDTNTILTRQYLRANQVLTQDYITWFMTKAPIDQDILSNGLAYSLFLNTRGDEVDFDIIFKIRPCNNTYII